YHLSPLSKGDLYLRLLPLINSGRVRLLDHPQLLRELRGLERRRGWGGRDRVDHRRGAHDDAANAAAGAIVLAAEGALRPPVRLWGGGIRDEEDEQAERQSNHEGLVDRISRGGGVCMPGRDGWGGL